MMIPIMPDLKSAPKPLPAAPPLPVGNPFNPTNLVMHEFDEVIDDIMNKMLARMRAMTVFTNMEPMPNIVLVHSAKIAYGSWKNWLKFKRRGIVCILCDMETKNIKHDQVAFTVCDGEKNQISHDDETIFMLFTKDSGMYDAMKKVIKNHKGSFFMNTDTFETADADSNPGRIMKMKMLGEDK